MFLDRQQFLVSCLLHDHLQSGAVRVDDRRGLRMECDAVIEIQDHELIVGVSF
jgi:hypothetical protein